MIMTFPRFVTALVLASALLPVATAGAQQLYWLDTRFAAPTLNRANPDGSLPHSIALPPGSLPEGLVVDPVTHALYWTEATFTGARVRRCGLDFSFPADVVTGGSALRGIAVDGAGGRLFWTTSNTVTGPSIRRSSMNGSGLATILALGAASNPRGIAYSAASPPASLYVCDADADMLYRFDPNGVGGPLLALPANMRPYGIAVDESSGLVYFTEYRKGRIERCTAGGTAETVLLTTAVNPTYIALDPQEGRMFWVEGGPGTQRVMRANLDGSAAINLALPVTSYGGIAYAPASLIAGVDGSPALELSLGAVSPNPAFGEAHLDFALPREGRVRLSVLDLQGREVAVLADGVQEAGRHTAALDAAALHPGMYFVRMRASGANLGRRLVVVR
jgi:DNA-binding beta-propeller fold protein YncE